MSNTITRMSGENLTALQAYVTSGFQALATRVAGSFDQIGSVSSQPVSSQPAMQTSSPVGSTALTQDKPSQNYAANQVKSNYVHTQTNTYLEPRRGCSTGKSAGRAPLRIDQSSAGSLDDLVHPQEQRRRDGQAERLRGLEVDDESELRGLLDRKLAGLRALKYFVHGDRRASSQLLPVDFASHGRTAGWTRRRPIQPRASFAAPFPRLGK